MLLMAFLLSARREKIKTADPSHVCLFLSQFSGAGIQLLPRLWRCQFRAGEQDGGVPGPRALSCSPSDKKHEKGQSRAAVSD
jgi:hypothetical protein